MQTDNWQTVERPGYFGKHRDERYREFDESYGEGNWRIAWKFGGITLSSLIEVCMFYEDSYYWFLYRHQEVLVELIGVASDVYDDDPSNMGSGYDYSIQETSRTHLQDIAIRRSVLRLGRRFVGPEPIQIRDKLGEHPLSLTLSPGRVPFHMPKIIVTPELEGWWEPGSVESFYQSNKVLQVRRQDG